MPDTLRQFDATVGRAPNATAVYGLLGNFHRLTTNYCDAGCSRRDTTTLGKLLTPCSVHQVVQEGLAVASIARDVVVEMTPLSDDNAR